MKKIFLLLLITAGFLQATAQLDSKINSSDVKVPEVIHTGKRAQVTLKVYNIGKLDWKNSEVALRVTVARGPSGMTNAQEEDLTTEGDIKLDKTEVDSETGYARVAFDIVGPEIAGEYILQFQLVYRGSKLFGAKVQQDITVINEKLDEIDCRMGAYISLGEVKSPVKAWAGKKYIISVNAKNIGTCDWKTQPNEIELKVTCVSSPDAARGETYKLIPGNGYLTASERQVDAGEFADHEYSIVAPNTPGKYIMQWQMTNKRKPFGSKFQKMIEVTQDSKDCDIKGSFDFPGFPTQMIYNKEYYIDLKLYNMGDCEWNNYTKIEIRCKVFVPPGSPKDLPGLLPNSSGVIPVGSTVIVPDKYFQYKYKVKGPYVPGIYTLEWSVYHNGSAVSSLKEERSFQVIVPK